jgi:hypothetical protein
MRAHNSGVFKSALGHSHSRVTRTCVVCRATFERLVKNVERSGGFYCSKRCNPAYAARDSRKVIARRTNLKSKYGLTLAQFDAMMAQQNNACAICGTEAVDRWGRLHVDHCHASGNVRGLLCGACNKGLGHFRDSATLLHAAVAYLSNGTTP